MNTNKKELSINEMEQASGGMIPLLIAAIAIQVAIIGTAAGVSIAQGKQN